MRRAAASLLVLAAVAARAQVPGPDRPAVLPAWSVATEGSGIPSGQKAADYAAEVDLEVVHGGRAAASIRSVVEKPAGFRAITQLIKADAYRGRRVRLAGYLKTHDVSEMSSLWLRVDGPDALLGFDNMDPRPVKGTTDWTRHEVVLDVPETALRLAFGPLLVGAGRVWADDLTLDVVDPGQVKSTQLVQYSMSHSEHASNFGFEAAADDAVPGWDLHGHEPAAYTRRIAEAGAHGGRSFLEVKSTGRGTPAVFSAAQNFAAAPYRGKRILFRAHLKTEGVDQEACLTMEVWARSSWIRANNAGRGPKGRTDWEPREVVLDVPADAEILGLGVELRGAGTLGVDDVSVEVVDPARVAVTPESERDRAAREKRSRELAEAYPNLPDRPENLDFER